MSKKQKWSPRAEQQMLRKCGFPIAVDGNVGSRTRSARRDFRRAAPHFARTTWRGYQARLRWSAKHGGRASDHFYYREWASNGNGWIKIDRALLRRLEKYRKRSGRAVCILSGYRDPAWNDAVGGSTMSMHMYGAAFDPIDDLNAAIGKSSGFSGIGVRSSNRNAMRHGDVRGQGRSPNFTGGTSGNPTMWVYAS